MHQILATRTVSKTNYNPPLHGAVAQILIEQVLIKTEEGYQAYEAERTITTYGGDWKKQISTPVPAPKDWLRELGYNG